ncbi:hypothetical protein EDC44_12819 [Cricetibacter osteomyelitidis]|uniref:Uncharacterized protein n=1 Tax=Cricetibacter osteomyelitidis TaxID=1521931 RepID=A0A4R2SUA4_9PAST|nr:hypothetical protein [Cricetibacter osteomyelitidis]TCP92066.1 hypothetical protein EDC44_12819 [Cricetibacter osteomyelitidis]
MRFKEIYHNSEYNFSLGVDTITNRFFLSFPVTTGVVDYEEHYFIPKVMIEKYPLNIETILIFLEQCKKRKQDRFLIIKPGWNRGTPYS